MILFNDFSKVFLSVLNFCPLHLFIKISVYRSNLYCNIPRVTGNHLTLSSCHKVRIRVKVSQAFESEFILHYVIHEYGFLLNLTLHNKYLNSCACILFKCTHTYIIV